ncbi:hypothetical protein Vi05172_g3393 [Venturia inaequalis]|nr:hypothetical protein Vi05172_g3393 [Venturia inaequalis]
MAERILMNEYRELSKEKWTNIEASSLTRSATSRAIH